MQWLYDHWMKATPFLAFYTTILIWLYVKEQNYALFLIWMQTPIYWLHEFEEYICPGGFLDFFNRKPLGSVRGDYPLTKAGSFWINIPLVAVVRCHFTLLRCRMGTLDSLFLCIERIGACSDVLHLRV